MEETGSLTDGKPHGQWVKRHVNGNVGEVPYVEGEKHSQWVIREPDGDTRYVTYENGEEVRRSGRRQCQAGSATAGGGPCQVPGYPNPPGGVANLGFSSCPTSVELQVRGFALQAAGAQCAIATSSSSTPEQIEAAGDQGGLRPAGGLGPGQLPVPAGPAAVKPLTADCQEIFQPNWRHPLARQ